MTTLAELEKQLTILRNRLSDQDSALVDILLETLAAWRDDARTPEELERLSNHLNAARGRDAGFIKPLRPRSRAGRKWFVSISIPLAGGPSVF